MTWNQRLGWFLFTIYATYYFAFVGVSAFVPSWMQWEMWPGLNLAVVWGTSLILFAFLLAAIYGLAARPHSKEG